MTPQAMLVFVLGMTLVALSVHEYWSPQFRAILE